MKLTNPYAHLDFVPLGNTRVKLNEEQRDWAYTESRRRFADNQKRAVKNNAPNDPPTAWRYTWVGCCGEVAFSDGYLHVGNPFELYEYGSADVLGIYEVRTRDWAKKKAIVQCDDKPHRIVVLVSFEKPIFRICRWIYARDAMLEKWWEIRIRPSGDRSAYFVPEKEMNEIEVLPTRRPDDVPETNRPWDAAKRKELEEQKRKRRT